MRKLMLVVSVLVLASFNVLAEGTHDPVETIIGSGFDLKHINDDIVLGTFNNIPMWAEKVCGSHIRGFYRENKENKNFSVEVVEKKLTATFPKGVFQLAGLDKTNQNILIKVDDKVISVHYEFEGFNAEEGHYFGISFNFENNGKLYNIKLNGEGCLGTIAYYSLFFYGVTTLDSQN